MNIAQKICSTRNTVCPRTSYSSGGSGATKLIIFQGATDTDLQATWQSVFDKIVRLKEFDEGQTFTAFEDLSDFGLVGHVICIVGNVNKAQLAEILGLLDGKQSSLVFQVNRLSRRNEEGRSGRDEDSDEDEEGATASRKKESSRIKKSIETFNQQNVELLTWQIRISRMIVSSASTMKAAAESGAALTATAFNGQPGVWTKLQFRYLWGLLDGFKPKTDTEVAELNEGRLRVLQRLSTKSLVNGKKLSMNEWDELIRKALVEENLHDIGIYSMIREKTLGRSLEDSLNNVSSSSATSGMGNTEDAEEGRADHLVDATLECIPSTMRERAEKYVKSMLDYGCAEGAITATLGKRLKLKPHQIFGADVRAITSRDFTYVQLPAEDAEEAPSTTGTILPSVRDRSITVVNCAMVFHHVIHTASIMRELRRVVESPDGLLIIREHDCRNAPTAAFLDILHGLFSLAWKDPIEWPNFIAEYRAYYRSREEWTSLLQECGFTLHNNLPSSYNAAETSVFRNGHCSNVTRAYYAVYVPDWNYEKRIGTTPVAGQVAAAAHSAPTHRPASLSSLTASQLPSLSGKKRSVDKMDEDLDEATSKTNPTTLVLPPAVTTTSSSDKFPLVPTVISLKNSTPEQIIAHAASMAKRDYQVYESVSQPGRFYKFYPANGRKEWIHFI